MEGSNMDHGQIIALVILFVLCIAVTIHQFEGYSALISLGRCRKTRNNETKNDLAENGDMTEFNTDAVVTEAKMDPEMKRRFRRLRWRYLIVYWHAIYADWLNAPYLYTVFERHGFNRSTIAYILVTGYAVSATFGIVSGMVADKWGRKKACITYCIMYTVAIMLYAIPNLYLVLIGRLFDGMATNLLHSAFDSWIVCQCRGIEGFPPSALANIYQGATTGFSVSAIIAGIVASCVASSKFGVIGPFYLSAMHLIICAILIVFLWHENYGMANQIGVFKGLGLALKQLRIPIVWMTGIIQSIFEASMFSFVYFWSPSLPSTVDRGLTFSIFMSCLLLGGFFAGILQKFGLPPALSVVGYLTLAAGSLLLASLTPFHNAPLRLLAFSLFEMACGLHMTAFYYLRGNFILSEDGRTLLINIFRIPLNLLVIAICVASASISLNSIMQICVACLFGAIMIAASIHYILSNNKENIISQRIQAPETPED